MSETGHVDAVVVRLQRLRDDAATPRYMTPGAAGADLCAAIDTPLTLAPGERRLVPTGIAIELPAGFEAQVRPRSGLALRHGVGLLNTPGTIDADYRGEIQVLLVNWGQQPFRLERGERIAQLVVAPVTRAAWEVVASLAATSRGDGGFGHTGRD